MENKSFWGWFAGRWWFLLIVFGHAVRGTKDMNQGETLLAMLLTAFIIVGLMYWYWFKNEKDRDI